MLLVACYQLGGALDGWRLPTFHQLPSKLIIITQGAHAKELLIHREELYETSTFKERKLAALVASKVYYHLGEYDESMLFALGAGDLFDITAGGEYVETIICTNHPLESFRPSY